MNNFSVMATILVNVLISIMLTGGICILFKKQFKLWYTKFIMRKRLQARKRLMKDKDWIELHLEQLLTVAFKKQISTRTFMIAEASTFLSIFLIGSKNLPITTAFFLAILIMGMPYLLLRVRLEASRRKGSFEGETLVAEILSQYRICNFNIYRAIERVIEENREIKISNKLLFKLLIELRSTGNQDAIRRATDSFAYGINTNWSRMLANNIRIAAESGINVTLSIEDILIQLREARTLVEARKRLNSESARIVMFFIPLMYIGTVFLAIKYLDIKFEDFIENQLYTPQGFFLFIIILFLYLVNLAILEVVNNQRFDY